MSHGNCQSGDTTGFPLLLAQSIFSEWPATKNSQGQIQKVIAPTDFTVNWGQPTQSARISVSHSVAANGLPGKFQISGMNTITENTTLTYGNASYICSNVLSIVQNQHKNLNQNSEALYEIILAFQIANKSENPSSPDIILITRPIVFSQTYNSSQFLSAVDTAAAAQSGSTTTPVNMSTIFGYNTSTLMPMVSYQTCLPVKLTNTNVSPYTTMIGSIRMRVNVVIQPLYVVPSDNGLGLCSSINKYTLVTEPKKLVDIFLYNYKNPVFGGVNANVFIQFKDGLGSDGFPAALQQSNKSNYLVLIGQPSRISVLTELLNKIEVLIPETFLGKSLAEIANSTTPPPVVPKNKRFKCYTIDPNKDIVGDQIMVDPTTGQSLLDTMNKNLTDANGEAIQQTTYYTLYGDAITGSLIVKNTIPIAQNAWNLTDLNAFITQDGPRVRIAFASLTNTPVVNQSLNYIGDYSTLNSTMFSLNNASGDIIVSNGQRPIDFNEGLQNDTGSVNINVVTINGTAGSSGILPGDIEEILVFICIGIWTLMLSIYLCFIMSKILFLKEDESFPTYHIIIFCVLLAGLTLFSLYFREGEDSVDPRKNGVANALDPNRNGAANALDPNRNGAANAFDPNRNGAANAFDPNKNGVANAFDPNKNGIVK